MLRKLVLKNFQKHRSLTIKFDPHVTTIVGPNDAGKSSIIRALRWALLNRPASKTGLIKRGAKQCSVILRVGKKEIERQSSSKGNLYRLGSKRFRAFRSDVPVDISNLLKVDEINFQRQHEPAFWFALSPGNAAKELNKLVDLETIDAVQSAVNSILRDKKAELEAAQKRLKEAQSTVKSLSFVKRLDVKLGKLEKLYANRVESHRINAVALLLRQRTLSRLKHQNAAVATAGGSLAGRLATASGSLAGRIGGPRGLIPLLRQIVARRQKAEQSQIISTIKLPELPDQSLPDRIEHIQELLSVRQEKESQLCQHQRKLERRGERLEKKLGGRCPVCGGLLTNQMTL
jgi:DNA repair exonuclease SbcCD ATPase subunit